MSLSVLPAPHPTIAARSAAPDSSRPTSRATSSAAAPAVVSGLRHGSCWESAERRRERQEETDRLLALAAEATETGEREELHQQVVILNLGLADGIAARYSGRGIDWDDLVQVGRVGLVKAVRGYQAGKGAGFAAYATPTIAGEIKRHFRDFGWVIRPPRHLQELRQEASALEPALQQQLHRAPTCEELADALEVPAQELRDAWVAEGGYTALSLDAPSRSEAGSPLGELVPDERDDYDLVERLASLRPALCRLTPRERRIITLRFVSGCTQEEIGRELGVSQMQVSRLLAGILSRLRDELLEDEQAS